MGDSQKLRKHQLHTLKLAQRTGSEMSNNYTTPYHYLVHSINQRHVSAYEGLPNIKNIIRTRLIKPFQRWYQRRATILELENLSNYMLADIGITRGEILHAVDGNIYKRGGTDERLIRG